MLNLCRFISVVFRGIVGIIFAIHGRRSPMVALLNRILGGEVEWTHNGDKESLFFPVEWLDKKEFNFFIY